MKVNIEVTDTFGGEANYRWVKRFSLELLDSASDLSVVRAVNGIPQICFVNFEFG